jgi:hypothetical protein
MNERIKSLLAKAHLDVMADLGDIDSNHVAEKFAELIVRECAKFLDENSGSDQCNNVWYPTPEEMLQHFGVEE